LVAIAPFTVYLEFVLSLAPMSEDRETRRYLVSGRVQGVGFRWYVEREAATLGITGWVRNRDDGQVEVMATGTREQLAGLHRKLREGPRAARVDEVAVSSAPFLDAKSFGIEGVW
jgi:acylphosphatase